MINLFIGVQKIIFSLTEWKMVLYSAEKVFQSGATIHENNGRDGGPLVWKATRHIFVSVSVFVLAIKLQAELLISSNGYGSISHRIHAVVASIHPSSAPNRM